MEFPQGTDKSVFLEKAYFMDLIMSQIKHKLMRLLTMAGSRIQHRLTSVLQSDQSGMCSCSFAKEEPTKRGLYSFIDYFVHSI